MSVLLQQRLALIVGASSLCATAASAQAPPPPAYPVLRPNGRLQADAGFYEDAKKNLSNGTEIRRARLAVLGQVAPLWSFQLELEYADDDARVSDAWIMFAPNPNLRVQFGNFKEPTNLEGVTSSRYLTFMERSLVDGFTPSRHIGAALRTNFGPPNLFAPVTAAIGLFGQAPGDVGEDDLDDSEAWGVVARATVAPGYSLAGRWLHLGASARYRTPDARTGGGDRVRFRAYPEAHLDRTRFLDTGNITGVDAYQQLWAEAAGVWGPVSLQVENLWTRVLRNDLDDPTIGGGYAFISWFVTGESRAYDLLNGAFLQPVPRRPLGALELAVRYSVLDLNEQDVTGGFGENWTFGVNWYVNNFVRFTANYMIVHNDLLADANGTVEGDDDFRALLFRVGYFF
jgi:phosphate-selective porin OprO/OprP